MKKNTAVPTTYIPLEKFHIVPITGLTPESLKYSAKKTIRDREKIPHTTKLNILAKNLGIKGGFANYEKEFEEKLKPFMAAQNLHKRVNLVEHKYNSGSPSDYKQFTHQQVSERLFYSKGPIPSKLFTGYDFDFSGVLAWHRHALREVLRNDKYLECIFTEDLHMKLFCDDSFDLDEYIEDMKQSDFVGYNESRFKELLSLELNTKIPITKRRTGNVISNFGFVGDNLNTASSQTAEYEEVVVSILDLIIISNRSEIISCYNLLGNNLTELYDPILGSEVEVYYEKSTSQGECPVYMKPTKFIQKVLNQRFQQSVKGWVQVIPYNDNLIFLSDENGNYDFVIKNQRNKVFTHQIYGDYLKRADIPSFIEDYRFKRWEYFNYKGNREFDSHLAEQHYYANGGLTKNYPGQHLILQNYYEASGDYIIESRSSNKHLYGFKKVKLANKKLMVSELITIDELNDFLHKNHEYFATRKGDALPPLNTEADKNLAATCTFYDVLAYVSWAEKETNVPLRLLAYDEYLAVRDNDLGTNASFKGGGYMTFYTPNGKQYPNHPPHMSQSDFDALTLRFPENLTNFEKNGLEFIDSNFFAEWLLEGVNIRSASLTSFYGDAYVLRASGQRNCTGKYKGVKTGFRLCYELSK